MAETSGGQPPPPESRTPSRGPSGSTSELEGRIESAVIRKSRPISIIWLVPIVAALTGGFLAWKAITDQGPTVSIFFESAAGLAPDKTKIKYKDVEVGVVEEIRITDDLQRVEVTARLVKEAAGYLNENTRFWVVKAQVTAGSVSGLDTLLGGAYIEIDLSDEGARQRVFEGLSAPPVVSSDEAGSVYTLRSDEPGSLTVGAPVYYRSFQVGKVTSLELEEGSDSVSLQIFVEDPYDDRVKAETRFWNASGLDMVINAEGIRIDTPSVVSMLIGGIAFADPIGFSGATPVERETIFTLYANRDASSQPRYKRKSRFIAFFEQSVAGLEPGAPVEFRGIKLGRVVDLQLAYDPEGGGVEIPVLLELEPDRIRAYSDSLEDQRSDLVSMVEAGLRARLATGNLITGALKIELDFVPDAPPATLTQSGEYAVIPTAPTPLNQITNSLTRTLAKLEEVPIEQIGVQLESLLAELNGVSEQINRDVAPSLVASLSRLEASLDSLEGVIGPDAVIRGELEQILVDLGDTLNSTRLLSERLEQHPEELLRGKQ